ncbi:MAG: hypothetical protein IJ106_10520 [Parasporobacterium sp.]|nr:hypothetical protein [Parasporobacterium sp.]
MNQVYFGTVRSYTDLGLMLTDVEISSPEPKRILADVPGMDGQLDLTFSLAKEVRFKNRKITLTFVKANYRNEWQQIFSTIYNRVHGRMFQVRIEPDLTRYWSAFCTVSKTKSNKKKGTFVIELDAYPYQYNVINTVYEVIAASIGKSQICTNSRMPVQPQFLATEACTVSFGEITHTLAAQTPEVFTDIIFTEGSNEVILAGSGTVTITYREGTL